MGILYDEQSRALALDETAAEILNTARSELYMNMRFLDVALSSLALAPDQTIRTAGTDGRVFYYNTNAIASLFYAGRENVNRLYLHSILHCLFAHLWLKGERDAALWDLSCDIAVEHIIDTLLIRAVHRPVPTVRRELYRSLSEASHSLNAQRIYQSLLDFSPEESQISALKAAFTVDDHSRWEDQNTNAGQPPQQQRWDEVRDRMQTELETFGKDASLDVESLEEEVRAANRKHYDYREFLQKFSVLKEEMQTDPDSFDYIYYHYGMELYGNMPLIEPLETREVMKVEDFVIVLDTSLSCEGDLLLHFLEETYSILSESESFFRKIHIHILQCDDRVQEDVLITSREEMKHYLEHFTIRGGGGTDFRPPFVRVQELLSRGCFTKLRGLIYFTDGYGTFPVKKPPYEVAFVFLREDYRDVDVPPWAIKLIVDREELMES